MQQSARACIEVTSLRVAASRVSRVVRLARAQKAVMKWYGTCMQQSARGSVKVTSLRTAVSLVSGWLGAPDARAESKISP